MRFLAKDALALLWAASLIGCHQTITHPRPPFQFSHTENSLLDEVQHGAFLTLWIQVAPETELALDRSSSHIVSVAGVGMQLSAIPIGVERGWISRDEGRRRALRVLESLEGTPDNRKQGMFYHFLDGRSAAPTDLEFESDVSSADAAILIAGVLVASAYFGDEVAAHADALIERANWTLFIDPHAPPPHEGSISLAWRPDNFDDPTGPGSLQPYHWLDALGEQRLVAFLANCAPNLDHRLDPAAYYTLRRQLGVYRKDEPFVFSPFTGALFTFMLSHLWIDYAAMGTDDPASQGTDLRPAIDWWENSRRAYEMQRERSIENPYGFRGFNRDAWGFSASDTPRGYLVTGLMPDPLPIRAGVIEKDFTTLVAVQAWGDGTISPHVAGSAILFEPEWGLDSMAYHRSLLDGKGEPLVWRAPGSDGLGVGSGGQGFLDAYNLGQFGQEPWVASDYLALNQGMLLLAIENARSGLIWELFHSHRFVRAGMARLGLAQPGLESP